MGWGFADLAARQLLDWVKGQVAGVVAICYERIASKAQTSATENARNVVGPRPVLRLLNRVARHGSRLATYSDPRLCKQEQQGQEEQGNSVQTSELDTSPLLFN